MGVYWSDPNKGLVSAKGRFIIANHRWVKRDFQDRAILSLMEDGAYVPPKMQQQIVLARIREKLFTVALIRCQRPQMV